MGGLFSAPKPVVVDPPSQPEQQAVVQQTAAQSQAAAEDATREARVKAVERARRGLAGTIATSDRGVLAALPDFATRKTLLGE